MTLFLVTSAGARATTQAALETPGAAETLSQASHGHDLPPPDLEGSTADEPEAATGGQSADPQATSTQALPGSLPTSLLVGIAGVAAVTAGGLLALHARRPGVDEDDKEPTEAPPTDEPVASTGERDPGDALDDEPDLETVTVEFPADLPAGLGGILRLGQRAVDQGEYEDAAIWFRTALDVRPDLPVAHLCLGLCRAEIEGPEAALESLDQAIELDPTNAMARYCRAQALAKNGHTSQAMDALAPLIVGTEAMADAVLSDPAFTELRDHPRLLALLGRL